MIDPAAKSLLDDNRDALLGDDYYADLPGVNPSGLPLTLALQGSAAVTSVDGVADFGASKRLDPAQARAAAESLMRER